MKKSHEPTYIFVILTLILIVINTALAWLSSLFTSSTMSVVSWLYIAVAFMILFTLWFGAYGAIAAYVGTFIGALLSSGELASHPEVAFYWAIAGLLQVLIPLVALRSFDVDLSLANIRDVNLLVIFGVIINNVIGAAWGAWTLSLGNIITPDKIGSAFSTWLIGNIIVTIVIVPLALRCLTPRIQKSRIFVKNYWD